VLDIVGHRTVRLSDVDVSDILDSNHMQILFHILDNVSTGDISAPVEIHIDWQRFRSLTSDFVSPRIQIHTVNDPKRVACDFAASIASAYSLSTRKITLSELKTS